MSVLYQIVGIFVDSALFFSRANVCCEPPCCQVCIIRCRWWVQNPHRRLYICLISHLDAAKIRRWWWLSSYSSWLAVSGTKWTNNRRSSGSFKSCCDIFWVTSHAISQKLSSKAFFERQKARGRDLSKVDCLLAINSSDMLLMKNTAG